MCFSGNVEAADATRRVTKALCEQPFSQGTNLSDMPRLPPDGITQQQDEVLQEAVNLCFEVDTELGAEMADVLGLRRQSRQTGEMHPRSIGSAMMTALRMLIHLMHEVDDERAPHIDRCIDLLITRLERDTTIPRLH